MAVMVLVMERSAAEATIACRSGKLPSLLWKSGARTSFAMPTLRDSRGLHPDSFDADPDVPVRERFLRRTGNMAAVSFDPIDDEAIFPP